MFFDSWFGLLRVLVVGTAAYASLVLLLRVSGKRTLAKLNAFDLIVTVALGSTLATVLLSESVALVEGLTAFALLAGLQYVVAWLSIRSPRFSGFVKSEPTLLLHHGRFLDDAMRAQRVTRAEVLSPCGARARSSPGKLRQWFSRRMEVSASSRTRASPTLSARWTVSEVPMAGPVTDCVGMPIRRRCAEA